MTEFWTRCCRYELQTSAGGERQDRVCADAEATIGLGESSGYPRLNENRRMRRSDVTQVLQAVFENRSMLQRRWSEIHG